MSHIFSYPSAALPTTTILRLHPALVTIQEEDFAFVQRMLDAADGTPWVFQLAGIDPQTYDVLVADLQEADLGGFSGYLTSRSFFRNITNWRDDGLVFDAY